MSLPPPRIDTTDPSQQDISEDSDHFSSASEGHSHLHPNPHAPPSPNSLSPDNVPITRVERVDDSAGYGEVPGTPAYEMRMADAVPDEIEVVPEGRRSRSATTSSQPRSRSHSQLSTGSRPATPGGTPIPRTVVEKVDFKPSYGEVEGTPAKEMRMADAMPDEIRKAPFNAGARLEGRPQPSAQRQIIEDDGTEEGRQAWFRSMWESEQPEQEQEVPQENGQDEDEDDDFGDDFDEFAEGGEGDEDFGDFDEAEDEPPAPSQPPPSQFTTTPDILKGLPPLNLSACTTPDEIQEAITPYINAILPNSTPIPTAESTHTRNPSMADTSPFLSDRSLSLWQQLVSPPPMQPPNWTRSRIRRLFLVSLGVPVDLDEILPPSKQKRLVLPSIGLDGPPSSNQLERLKESEANDSATSIDSKTGTPRPRQSAKRVSKIPPPPTFDTLAAGRLAATTEEALSVFSDQELQQHVLTLRVLNEEASRVLEYWLQRKDEGVKEKEALEGVIENLVGWVKGGRGATGKGGKGR